MFTFPTKVPYFDEALRYLSKIVTGFNYYNLIPDNNYELLGFSLQLLALSGIFFSAEYDDPRMRRKYSKPCLAVLIVLSDLKFIGLKEEIASLRVKVDDLTLKLNNNSFQDAWKEPQDGTSANDESGWQDEYDEYNEDDILINDDEEQDEEG